MTDQDHDRFLPSWLLWIIGPVSVLAAALIIVALVLGIRAGQRQVEIQRQQQVGIALQRATDYRAEGRLEDALAEYQRVLMLDPGNSAAVAGIESLLDMASAGGQPVSVPQPQAATTAPDVAGNATPPANPANSAPPTAATMTPTPSSRAEELWNDAVTAYELGRWDEAASLLVQVQLAAPDFRTQQTNEMLYNAYVNLAAAKDSEGNLEEALRYVDKALSIRPNSPSLQVAREKAAKYLDMLGYVDVDWASAVQLLEELYTEDPTYRDVETRYLEALLTYAGMLADDEDWCAAADQYAAAIAIDSDSDLVAERDRLDTQCRIAGAPPTVIPTRTPASIGRSAPTATPASTAGVTSDDELSAALVDEDEAVSDAASNDATDVVTDTAVDGAVGVDNETESEEVAASAVPAAPAGAPSGGRILYSEVDSVTGRNNIFIRAVDGGDAMLLVEDGQQAAMRPDGQRLVYRNLRGDMAGITSLDPATGLTLRFTDFAEDGYPSWNGEGNRITFASNREGDRLWRVYTLWADVGSEAEVMAYGDEPDWSPVTDRIVYRGCDESGNRCGLWTMTGSGGDRRGITSVASDTQPSWSPDGQYVVFMSDGRDGNPDVYRVPAAGGSVTRLTNSPSIDGLPAISPDSAWVAFMSNRNGAWAVWAVPAAGGEAQQLFTLDSAGTWQEQALQWVP